MESILSSWGRVARFILIISTLIILILFTLNKFFNNSEVSLEFSDNRTLIKVKDGSQTTTQSILAASDCWVKTGIEIKPGESYKIKVLGKVHTAADYLLKNVAQDTIPLFEWCGAEGRTFRIRNEEKYQKFDRLRKNLLIKPNANIGCVLFYFQEQDEKEPSCDTGDEFNPTPKNIIVYDNTKGNLIDKNQTEKVLYVWACVNDMLIMDTTESVMQAYLGGNLDSKELKRKTKNWEDIKNTGYRRLWFDDNIGNYIISAQVKE